MNTDLLQTFEYSSSDFSPGDLACFDYTSAKGTESVRCGVVVEVKDNGNILLEDFTENHSLRSFSPNGIENPLVLRWIETANAELKKTRLRDVIRRWLRI